MKKILFAIAAALMTATTLNAQTAAEQAQAQASLNAIHMKLLNAKPSKQAKKQAKEFKRQGWKEPAGELAIEQQLTQAQLYAMEQITDASGVNQRRFIQVTGRQTSGSYNAGFAAARAAAQTELASMLQTEIVAAWQQKIDNQQQTATTALTSDKFDQRVKAVVDQTLTGSIPVVAIYRVLPNDMYEVEVRLAYDKLEVMKRLHQGLQQQMEQDGDKLEKIVDQIIETKL
ncbi:MAG: hypothetical protein J5552_02675 [Prevotella sp.]|nr:hypothetical protein [Prevotella sp.]